MHTDSGFLEKEDYVEPRCVLCGDPYGKTPEVKPVPQQRIIEKMDDYMSRLDYDGAERHLLYWLEEARLGNDLRGMLTIQNELIGHYRKVFKREEAFRSIRDALDLVKELGFEGTISSGTTYTNAATAYYTFEEYEKSLSYFQKAKPVYESSEKTDPSLLGGLYNNMALTCAALHLYQDAYTYYDHALQCMEHVPGGILEQAITYLNMANAVEQELGAEQAEQKIMTFLDQAEELLNQGQNITDTEEGPSSGYYAFVCDSCAPTFAYYGYFLTAEELKRRAKEIYERN